MSPNTKPSFWGSCKHAQRHCSSWHLGLGIVVREHLSYPKSGNLQRSSSRSGHPQLGAEHAGPCSLCHPPAPSEGAAWVTGMDPALPAPTAARGARGTRDECLGQERLRQRQWKEAGVSWGRISPSAEGLCRRTYICLQEPDGSG